MSSEIEGAGPESDPLVAASPLLSLDIITLFPPLFSCWLEQGVVSRAVERGIARISLINLREFGVGKHLMTDDYPFGGGAGMVMKPEPLFSAIESINVSDPVPIILLSPQGNRFTHRMARDLARLDRLVLVCGHYEGVDERVREHAITEEISIGDYILSAGELAAMVVADAVVRLLPGALASDSTTEESFAEGILEYPQYTRPSSYRGWNVPDVLLSGHHGEIARWRRLESLRKTYRLRPDLLENGDLSEEERRLIARWHEED